MLIVADGGGATTKRVGNDSPSTLRTRNACSPTTDKSGIEAESPNDFVLDLIGINHRAVYACLQQIVDERTSSSETLDDLLSQLERSGLIDTAAFLRLS